MPMPMPAVLPMIFFVYNLLNTILVYLVPKKLRTYIPTSWQTPHNLSSVSGEPAATEASPPSSSPSSLVDPVGTSFAMDAYELRRVFQIFDRDGDGSITTKELNESLEHMGIFISDSDLMHMITRVDVDGDGCLDIDEFADFYRTIIMERREEVGEEDIREAFNAFDQNRDGFITVEELKTVLSSLGLNQGNTSEDCKMMITKVDADGDGKVDFSEFKQMMKFKGGQLGAFAA